MDNNQFEMIPYLSWLIECKPFSLQTIIVTESAVQMTHFLNADEKIVSSKIQAKQEIHHLIFVNHFLVMLLIKTCMLIEFVMSLYKKQN